MRFPRLSDFKRFAWRTLLEKMQFDSKLESGLVVPIRSFADWCTFNEVFVRGEYDLAIEKALADATSDQIDVLDCGANTGFFSLRLIDRFLSLGRAQRLRLCLVEAQPSLVETLEHRFRAISHDNVSVTIRGGLVGHRSGFATLQLGREDNSSYVGESPTGSAQTRGKISQLSYVDLETLVDGGSLNLLKVDIEGSEFQLINSYPSLLRRTRVLAVEFHAAFGDIAGSVQRLGELGFSLVKSGQTAPTTPVMIFVQTAIPSVE